MREEQRLVKEVGKRLSGCIKGLSKECGFLKVGGFVYKFIGDFVYVGIISVPPVDAGTRLRIDFYYKPWILDEVFWEIFEIKEGPKQPKSFHVRGTFTAPLVQIENYKVVIPDIEGMDTAYKNILVGLTQKIKDHHKKIYDLTTFQSDIKGNEHQLLNYILTEVCQENHAVAKNLLETAISQGKSGGFADISQKSIFQYALEYCQQRT